MKGFDTMPVAFHVLALVVAPCFAAEPDGQVIETLRIDEHFGVSHPVQVIDFDLKAKANPAKVRVVDADGQPVVFQLLEGGTKVAIQTDLPAGASKHWKLVTGRSLKKTSTDLKVTEYRDKTGGGYQITNGMTGVRVPKPVTSRSVPVRPLVDLFNYGPAYPRLFPPAPVQGILFRDAKWHGTGPNGLVLLAHAFVKMDVRFLESGPLKVVAEVSYLVDHPEYQYGSTRLKPAGRGYYRCTITVQADQPSILFEEDTDLEMTWALNLYQDHHPTKARYRGHHATTPEYGHSPDGQTYVGPGLDAEVDLAYEKAKLASYITSPESWRWTAVWDPWIVDSGWYWQMFNAQEGDEGNLVGIFPGRASRALGTSAGGVAPLTMPSSGRGDSRVAGFTVGSYRRSASDQVYPRSRFQWGLFVGTKKDLKDPKEVQPINLQMNLHGGLSLNQVHRYTLDFDDPPAGYGGLYMDRTAVEALKRKLRADKSGQYGGGFHQFLYNGEPTSRPLIDMWADEGSEKLSLAVQEVHQTATSLLNALVQGEGIYSFPWMYWHGGLAMMRHGIWIDQILADPRTTEADRRKVKAAAVLFANVLWDNDFVPLDNDHGLNLGTANMPVQQTGYRRFYALLLARHPTMQQRADQVEASIRVTLNGLINEHGAEIGCPHYIGASFAPTLNTLLQLKQLGKADLFRAEPRLARFAEFLLHFQTPPEPRVGGQRAQIALGDSSTEPSELYGVLGTGFRDADPALSARLMGAWKANGKPHSGFFGTTLLMIDESLPSADPLLGDATVPGYYSVLRHGWGTSNETAMWMVNGEHYSDHRHQDHGSVVIYALGQPLSVSWGGLYTPQAPGAYMKSSVVLQSSLGSGSDTLRAWDGDSPPLNLGGGWGNSSQEAFVSFPEGAYAKARFTTGKTGWTRSMLAIRGDESRPILVLRDAFTGEDARSTKIMSLNLMAVGEIEIPAGKLNPPERTHPAKEHRGEPQDELPSAAPPFELAPGINRLRFTGKYGIDWDLYTVSDQRQQALVGNWAVTPWGGHMTDKEERQHILRLRSEGPFVTLILPRRKGEESEAVSISRAGDAVVVKTATSTARIEPTGYSYTNDAGTVTRTVDKK